MFWVAALVAVVTSLMAVTGKNPVHALLWFVVSLLAMAVVFFVLGAAFAAALEVIVYAGAIVVLFLFVVMMLSLDRAAWAREGSWIRGPVWVAPVGFVVVLGGALGWEIFSVPLPVRAGRAVLPAEVGLKMFSGDILAVEMASLLLLAGLVAAFHLARGSER